jgi:hypothetical protein
VSQTAQFNFLQTQLPLNLFEDFPVKSYAVYRRLQWASVSPDLETTVQLLESFELKQLETA